PFAPVELSHRGYLPGVAVLVFLGDPRVGTATATLSPRLVEYRSTEIWPSLADGKPSRFKRPLDRSPQLYILGGTARDVQAPCLVTVECTITVTRDPLPAPNLDQHLGELLRSTDGADVTFAVAGESFAAHKSILTARSPRSMFKAEFYGEMEERTSRRVEIKDMDADVFGAMLRFIDTDNMPQLLLHRNKEEAIDEHGTVVVMAQHLLVAADRYGLDRLKAICERRLSLGIDVGTAASTLALAEQHGCERLKADCIDFIAGGSPENLHAVLATEGYKHLEASNPSVLTELFKVAKGRGIY
ncbi:hypothetical protein U9M48_036616, partial [Paspalum notatum var. saurae]